MAVERIVLELVGPRAGENFSVNPIFVFKKGRMEYVGAAQDIERVTKFAARNWNAHPIGSKAHEIAQQEYKLAIGEAEDSEGEDNGECTDNGGSDEPAGEPEVPTGGESDGEGSSSEGTDDLDGTDGAPRDASKHVADGDGHEGSGSDSELTEAQAKIQAVLVELNPLNDDHWTQGGLPKVTVVAEALKDDTILRKDIAGAIPDFDREAALEFAASQQF